jgi:hypothetical protein
MQRWIAAGVVAMMVLAGGLFGYYKMVYLPSRPQPVWVPLPINPELESAKRDEIIKDLKAKLSEPELLAKVSKDLGLPKKWNLPSDAECAKEIARRLFVRPGEADSSIGSVPAIHIGIKGEAKESGVSGEIAMRLMDEVWKILGIEPPKKKQS